jgi:hypothetical protein
MRKEYILKHKNYDVLLFDMDNEKYDILEIKKIINDERLPFGFQEKNNFIQCAIQLNAWIKGRGLSGSRKDINTIKDLFKVKDKSELIIKSYGLNLTDHYWLHETENNIKWENVNYFDNKFDEIKQSGNYEPVIDNSVKNQSPNFCVDGSIVKRWVIINDERYLLKGSRYARMQEPFNEKIASLILKELGIDHVNYCQKRTKENIPYSECKTMADKNIEFINAQWAINKEDFGRKEIYNHYLDMCKKHGINDVKEKIDEMTILDFIIGNEDRHRGNFGILRNADTLEWLRIAPIFDNGNSLFFDGETEDMDNWGLDSLGKAFGDSNRLQLNTIDYPEWYDVNKGKTILDIIPSELKNNERLKTERIDKIIEISKKRIEIFEKTIKQKTS